MVTSPTQYKGNILDLVITTVESNIKAIISVLPYQIQPVMADHRIVSFPLSPHVNQPPECALNLFLIIQKLIWWSLFLFNGSWLYIVRFFCPMMGKWWGSKSRNLLYMVHVCVPLFPKSSFEPINVWRGWIPNYNTTLIVYVPWRIALWLAYENCNVRTAIPWQSFYCQSWTHICMRKKVLF